MAELFGIASGIVSVAGFAGQLAQSTSFLYDFIKDIRGAPKLVQALGEELHIIGSILVEIQRSSINGNTDLEEPLQHCQRCVQELLEFVKKADPKQYAKRRRRIWSQFKMVLKRSDLNKYLGELERSKSMLLQACNNLIRSEQGAHTSHLQTIVQQTEDLSTEHKRSMAATEAVQHTVEKISSSLHSTAGRIVALTNETYTKTNEVHTKMDQIHHNTEQIREMIARLEAAQLRLVNETIAYQPMRFESFKEEVDCTISTSLRRHLSEHFGQPRADEVRLHPIDNRVAQSHYSEVTARRPELRNPCLGNEDTICFKSGPNKLVDCWTKKSSTESQRTLIQNAMFGTMSIRTTTASYIREDVKGHVELKQVTTTTLMILPALWLKSWGGVLRHHRSEFSSFAGSQGIPRWTFSTVNIISGESEIFSSCQTHDLDAIRRLFDGGCASPYDVDEDGRNTLAYVALGLQFHRFKGSHKSFQRRLDELEKIITLLIGYDVDSGCTDLCNTTPIALAANCWSDALLELPVISSLEEHYTFLLQKLLMSAKMDPFCASDALVHVMPDGEYIMDLFPGVPQDYCEFPISKLQLYFWMTQNEWQITWDPLQLNALSSAKSQMDFKQISDVRSYVAFWVTSDAETIRKLLDTKSDLLRKFLDLDLLRLERGADHCVIYALNIAIHDGGEVIALLTEHSYYSHDRQPWIRHRFKKLAFIEQWLTEVFQLLITKCITHVAKSDVISELCQHARKHNARTLCAWTKALKACAKEPSHLSASELRVPAPADDGITTRSNNREELETDDSWETEDTDVEESEWETEEELEDESMLETAIERDQYDARNPNLGDNDRHTCSEALKDYDEIYWSHVYPRIMRSSVDSAPQKHQESTLQKLGTYVRDFMALPLLGG